MKTIKLIGIFLLSLLVKIGFILLQLIVIVIDIAVGILSIIRKTIDFLMSETHREITKTQLQHGKTKKVIGKANEK